MGKCLNSTVINAPVDKVWTTIRDFYDMSWASNVATKVEPKSKYQGDQVGAKRVLNEAFHETLLSIDDAKREFSYSIDDGPGPAAKDAIKNYVGVVHLSPITADDTTFIEWQSTYDSVDENAVGDFCNPIYQALLTELKEYLS